MREGPGMSHGFLHLACLKLFIYQIEVMFVGPVIMLGRNRVMQIKIIQQIRRPYWFQGRLPDQVGDNAVGLYKILTLGGDDIPLPFRQRIDSYLRGVAVRRSPARGWKCNQTKLTIKQISGTWHTSFLPEDRIKCIYAGVLQKLSFSLKKWMKLDI